MAQWREDDLEDKVERGLNTGPDRAGYENINIAGYAKLVEKRSLPVMEKQEILWMEKQMELRGQ